MVRLESTGPEYKNCFQKSSKEDCIRSDSAEVPCIGWSAVWLSRSCHHHTQSEHKAPRRFQPQSLRQVCQLYRRTRASLTRMREARLRTCAIAQLLASPACTPSSSKSTLAKLASGSCLVLGSRITHPEGPLAETWQQTSQNLCAQQASKRLQERNSTQAALAVWSTLPEIHLRASEQVSKPQVTTLRFMEPEKGVGSAPARSVTQWQK
eukprot:4543832-Amphidinium_carterae.1